MAVFFSGMQLFVVGCDEQILHDLTEQEANKVISRLGVGKVDAKKVLQSDGRWAISVPQGHTVPTLAFLETNRVLSPRAALSAGSTKSGFIPSREEQWFRYERSVATSIEDSLNSVLGVLEARVHLNLPETDPLFGTRKESIGSGSVLLVVDQRYASRDEEIATLVAGAAGIPVTKVNVLRSAAQLGAAATPVRQPEEKNFRNPGESRQPEEHTSPMSMRSLPVEFGLLLIGVLALFVVAVLLVVRRRKHIRFPLPQSVVNES